MILTAEEMRDLDLLTRLVDESVVLRNQMIRAERDAERASYECAQLRRKLDLAIMQVEKQREKMTLAQRRRNTLESVPSRA